MPHDINGNLLEVGDRVTVEFTVKTVYTGTEFCNVTVETVEPMFPGEHKTGVTFNGKQVKKVNNEP